MAVKYFCDWCEKETTPKDDLQLYRWLVASDGLASESFVYLCAPCRVAAKLVPLISGDIANTAAIRAMAPFRAAALAKGETAPGTNWNTESVRVLLHNTAAALRQMAKHCDAEGRLSSGERPQIWFAQTANDLDYVLQQGDPR